MSSKSKDQSDDTRVAKPGYMTGGPLYSNPNVLEIKWLGTYTHGKK
jgi:hypothetical protein